MQKRRPPLRTAGQLSLIHLVDVPAGRISTVYLLDAARELGRALAWVRLEGVGRPADR